MFAGFAEDLAPSGALTVGRPPVHWLVGCAAVAVVAAVLAALFGDAPAVALAAWFAGGPVAVSLLGAFTLFDTRARAQAIYARQSWVRPAYVACLVLCGIAVVVSALRIAFWVGRL